MSDADQLPSDLTAPADGTVLDVWYPAPALGTDAPDTSADLTPLAGEDADRGVTLQVVDFFRAPTVANLAALVRAAGYPGS